MLKKIKINGFTRRGIVLLKETCKKDGESRVLFLKSMRKFKVVCGFNLTDMLYTPTLQKHKVSAGTEIHYSVT